MLGPFEIANSSRKRPPPTAPHYTPVHSLSWNKKAERPVVHHQMGQASQISTILCLCVKACESRVLWLWLLASRQVNSQIQSAQIVKITRSVAGCPFTCWWIFGLFPPVRCCSSCHVNMGVRVCLSSSFQFFGEDAQEWNCQVMWQFSIWLVWGAANPSSPLSVPSCIPTSTAQGLLFVHSLIWHLLFSTPVGMTWHPLEVLICIWHWTFLRCLLAVYVSSLRNGCPYPLPIFSLDFFLSVVEL